MTQRHYDVYKTNPQRLARLMRREEPAPTWRKEELGVILRHQLAASMADDLQASGISAAGLPACNPPIRTFMDLFAHPCPPLGYLEMTKVFAKRYMDRASGALPCEVATVLYYASIAVARLRYSRQITTLDDSAIRSGIDWVLCQDWISSSLVKLFRQVLPLLIGRRPSDR